MPIYDITNGELAEIPKTNFQTEGLRERQDIQRLLKNDINVICRGAKVISEEFGDFDQSNRRIDLLALDKNANLIVIELKRTEDGGHMELQAIRYASMVANMTWDQAIQAYTKYLNENNIDKDPVADLLDFLQWDMPQEDKFSQNIKIVLASADFSKELTTSVIWLNDHDLDIACVRMVPHKYEDRILLDIEQIIPIVEAGDYQIGVRQKKREVRMAQTSTRDRSLISISWNNEVYGEPIKKSDIGLRTIQLLNENNKITEEIFSVLKSNRSSSFDLIKSKDEVTDNEKRYSRYRIHLPCELEYGGKKYYITRNWGKGNIGRFIKDMMELFPELTYEILANN